MAVAEVASYGPGSVRTAELRGEAGFTLPWLGSWDGAERGAELPRVPDVAVRLPRLGASSVHAALCETRGSVLGD